MEQKVNQFLLGGLSATRAAREARTTIRMSKQNGDDNRFKLLSDGRSMYSMLSTIAL